MIVTDLSSSHSSTHYMYILCLLALPKISFYLFERYNLGIFLGQCSLDFNVIFVYEGFEFLVYNLTIIGFIMYLLYKKMRNLSNSISEIWNFGPSLSFINNNNNSWYLFQFVTVGFPLSFLVRTKNKLQLFKVPIPSQSAAQEAVYWNKTCENIWVFHF